MRRTNLETWIEHTEALPVLTREGLACLQLKKLNEVLLRAKQRGGIYRDYPDHLDSLVELEKLPFTTAEMLAAAPGKFLLTSQSEVSRVISGETSGTTGGAKRVFYTEQDTEHTVGFFAAGISEMLHPGEKCLICFPFSGEFGLGDLIAKAVERLGAIPVRAGFGQTWEELMELVRRESPQTYIGFPVPLLGLARLYGEGFPLQRALISADACPQGVVAELEALLGNPLYPHYGSRECGLGGAVTCPAHEGMHLRENHILAEIVDGEGNAVEEGQWGELVITTIGLEAMPLIRYRTGDYTRFLPPCPCGGVTRRIDAVTRREKWTMAALDEALFRNKALIDHRAAWDGTLHIQARTKAPGQAPDLKARAEAVFPHIPITVTEESAETIHRPLYLGKRRVEGG